MLHAVLSLVLGSLVGFSLGLIGGGGSILTVPLLVYVIGESVTSAIGTSLAIIGMNSLFGFVGHWRHGRVRFKTGIAFGGAGIAGAFAGAWLGHFISGKGILFLFALVMLAAAYAMLRRRRSPTVAAEGTEFCDEYDRRAWIRVILTGLLVGVLTGFFGVGGGFVIVPALVIVLRMPMHLAVGTSLLIIAINSASGLVAHLQYGGIDLVTTLLFASGGLLGVLIGAAFAGKIREAHLRQIFAYGMVVVALYLMYQNHPALPRNLAALPL
ncbi:MAG: sulfite exporter TauE/SafE family protein [Chloroflexota bacterium]